MKWLAVAIALLVSESAGAQAQEPRTWHLLTISEGGTVSLLKDLTKHQCEFSRARALGLPATDEEKAAEKKRREALSLAAKNACEGAKKVGWDVKMVGGLQVTCQNGEVNSYLTGGTTVISSGHIRSAECFE